MSDLELTTEEIRLIESRRAMAAMLVDDITLTREGKAVVVGHIIGAISELINVASSINVADDRFHQIARIISLDDRTCP